MTASCILMNLKGTAALHDIAVQGYIKPIVLVLSPTLKV